jgi:parvulin-like peptidyl-prolyl isomerase
MLRFLRGGGKRTKTIWWAIAIITIVTFVGGFVFLFGAGLDSSRQARSTGAVAVVGKTSISNLEYQNALAQQREGYRRQFGVEPAERDLKMIETQTWRQLVTERLVTDRAEAMGLRATDQDVLMAMQTNPPQALLTMPEFQTNGQFDPTKYRSALANPNVDWTPFETMARQQIPMRKLEERLLASLKVTDTELLQTFHDRYDRVDATVVAVVPTATDTARITPTDAELKATYDRYKGRFASGPRVQLEVVRVPKEYGESALRAARDKAADIVRRARAGEAFDALARTFSEGPNAEQGGLVPRPVTLQELGPELGTRVMGAPAGTIFDPMQDAGRFVIVKLVEKLPPAANGLPQSRIAQIIVKTDPDQATLRRQYDDLKRLRAQALSSHSLAQAASAKGVTTFKTSFYDYSNPPNELFTVPEAAEWGLGAKQGEVSPVFEGVDEFAIAQVAVHHVGGPASREEVAEPVRQLTEIGKRVDALKGRADAVAQAIAAGRSLEDAARAQGLEAMSLTGFSRATPDPRLGGAPEVVGALMAARPGQVVGPVRAVNGWYFARLNSVAAAPDTAFVTQKPAIAREILQRRQQSFFNGFMSDLREKAKVQDLRSAGID